MPLALRSTITTCRVISTRSCKSSRHFESAGKKIGNAHLRWAFAEIACLFLRASERAKRWKERQAKKHGSGKALGILAARLARSVFHMLRNALAVVPKTHMGED